ncbi:hypothetical protein FJTKL_06844 [Diaporthe vaccinii]|uniref:Uncharacterized protein n=1 Tax=Diaporthe vaccinii TaxID=105482 RepID=A0ABR4EVJ5_9PEZI
MIPYPPLCYNVAFVPAGRSLTIFPFLPATVINKDPTTTISESFPFFPTPSQKISRRLKYQLVAGTPYSKPAQHHSVTSCTCAVLPPIGPIGGLPPRPHATLPLQDPVVLAGYQRHPPISVTPYYPRQRVASHPVFPPFSICVFSPRKEHWRSKTTTPTITTPKHILQKRVDGGKNCSSSLSVSNSDHF